MYMTLMNSWMRSRLKMRRNMDARWIFLIFCLIMRKFQCLNFFVSPAECLNGTVAWFYSFMHQGVRYRGVGGTTKTQAQRALEKVRAKVLSGEYEFERPNNPTIETFAENFLQRRQDHRSYKRMYNLAIQWSDAKRNPVQGVKFLEEPKCADQFLDEVQAQRLINACASYFRPIVITALNTGMRVQEILSLKWTQVHLERKFVEIVKTKNNWRSDMSP